MRRYIILFLITGIVWAQTEFDKLVLKDGTTYWGEYSNTENEATISSFRGQLALKLKDLLEDWFM